MGLEQFASETNAWIWSYFGEIIISKAFGVIKEQWKKFNWDKASANYRNRIKDRYGIIQILNMPKPVDLEGVFTDIFIIDKPSALRRYNISQLKKDPSKPNAKRKSAIRIVLKENRIFILGKPGSGKTTLLKHLALQAANNNINKIPIFISLKDWADKNVELMDYLVRQFEICSFPDPQKFIELILKNGKALILFDGLDEVNQQNDQRAKIISDINSFIQQYYENQYLITCRVAATDYSFESFTYVEIADFTISQIHSFVEKWFSENPTKKKRFLDEFKKDEHKGLRELSRTPLLLVLLCLAFDETFTFPKRQVELYEEALDALLKKWDSARNIKRDEVYHQLSINRKRQMFSHIAASSFERGDYFISKEWLEKQIVTYLRKLPTIGLGDDIDSNVILRSIESQHGILIERSRGIYSFSHLTFQEYFTARYITNNTSEHVFKRTLEYMLDDRWYEVYLLTASLLDNPERFFELFRKAILNLAYKDSMIVGVINYLEQISQNLCDGNKFLSRAYSLSLALSCSRDIYSLLDKPRPFSYNIDKTRDKILLDCLDLSFTLSGEEVRHQISHLGEVLYIGYFTSMMTSSEDTSLKLNEIEKNLHRSISRSHNLGFVQLANELSGFALPKQKASLTEWQYISYKYLRVMDDLIGAKYFKELGREQLKLLVQYLRANILLIKCLDLAAVEDRSGIREKLLVI